MSLSPNGLLLRLLQICDNICMYTMRHLRCACDALSETTPNYRSLKAIVDLRTSVKTILDGEVIRLVDSHQTAFAAQLLIKVARQITLKISPETCALGITTRNIGRGWIAQTSRIRTTGRESSIQAGLFTCCTVA